MNDLSKRVVQNVFILAFIFVFTACSHSGDTVTIGSLLNDKVNRDKASRFSYCNTISDRIVHVKEVLNVSY